MTREGIVRIVPLLPAAAFWPALLAHFRVLDGTGAPPLDDRNVIVENGKIAAIG